MVRPLAERHRSEAAAIASTIQVTVVKANQGGALSARQIADSLNSALASSSSCFMVCIDFFALSG
jgi:hypothetical protein